MESILKDHEIELDKTIMIGDNLETDILFGKNCKLDTLLVFTGVTTEKTYFEGHEKTKIIIPTYVVDNLSTDNS